MLVTVFLSVLVVALFLGNAFLSLTDPKRLQRMLRPDQGQNGLQDFEDGSGQGDLNSFDETRAGLSFEQAADRERASYLNKRIERLEKLLLKINNSKFVAQKINGTNLFQKLKEFDQFKQDTKLEIAALRQRLDSIQIPKKKARLRKTGISDEKLREIVFRASN